MNNPEEREKFIAALMRERKGYEQAGKTDRVKAVDEQIRLYRMQGNARNAPPVGRTETPPTQTGKK